MTQHFEWLKPHPLWQDDGQDYRQPDVLPAAPVRLQLRRLCGRVHGRGADWERRAGRPASRSRSRTGATLKLFQPIHGSFYVVSGSLCCVEPGFPQRQVSLAGRREHLLRPAQADRRRGVWLDNDQRRRPAMASGRLAAGGQRRQGLLEQRGAATALPDSAQGRPHAAVWLRPGLQQGDLQRWAGRAGAVDRRAGKLVDRPARRRAAIPFHRPGDRAGGHADHRQIEPSPATTTPIRLHMSVFTLLDLWELLDRPDVLPDVAAALRDNLNATFTGDKGSREDGADELLQDLAVDRPAARWPARCRT